MDQLLLVAAPTGGGHRAPLTRRSYDLGMASPASERLPRGRHGLSREQVVSSQRARILLAMADVMAEKGYVATSVSQVVKRAGVSRETFYQLFASKQDCFMHALDSADGMLEALLENQVEHPGTVAERLDAAVALYLEALAFSPAMARLVLVEVYAAGPEALDRRSKTQRHIAHRLAAMLDVDDDFGRFGCELLVAGMGSLVTMPLVNGDLDALRAMREPLVALAVRHLELGDDHQLPGAEHPAPVNPPTPRPGRPPAPRGR